MTPATAVASAPPDTSSQQAIAASLEALNRRLDAIAEIVEPLRPVVELVGQARALAAMAGDTFDDVMRTAMKNGIDVERGLLNGAGAAIRFGATMDAEKVRELESLLQSGVLDPAALRMVGELARALSATAATSVQPAGALGLIKALGNPDVQRALGFLIAFAERFGDRLAHEPSRG
jgi:hypothetical protein